MHRLLRNRGTTVFVFVAVAAAMLSLLRAVSALAVEAPQGQATVVPCGVIQEMDGQVEMMDSSRTSLLSGGKKSFIPCGSWISTREGWARVRHRDGAIVQVGARSFVQFPETSVAVKKAEEIGKADQVVLFRGQIFAASEAGSGELRVVTANARARVSDSSALVVYDEGEQETQLIALENTSSLENRFEPLARARASAGEATSLNFKLLRVSPVAAKSVSLAALRAKLSDVHLGGKEKVVAVNATRKRLDRKVGTLTQRGPASEHAAESHESAEAVVEKPEKPGKAQHREPASESSAGEGEDDAQLHDRWISKMAAGDESGKAIIEPDSYYEKHRKVKKDIQEGAAKGHAERVPAGQNRSEEAERRKLIDELSKIRGE